MTIHIHNEAQNPQYYSEGGSFSNPLVIVKNGTVSNTQTILLYANNDSAITSYSAVTFKPEPDSKIGQTSVVGWYMKVLSGINGLPSESDWDAVDPANTVTYNDPGNGGVATTFPNNPSYFFPIYLRIYIPAGTPVQQTRVVKLKVDSTI